MRRVLLFSMALVASLFLYSGASADDVKVGDIIKFGDGYGTSGGGEFNAYGTTITPFVTFCLEKNEYMYYDIPFVVAAVNTQAVNGGIGGGSPDPLDPKSAYLYSSFRAKTLSGYIYDSGTKQIASANALQNAIWYIENEITTLPTGLATTFYNAAVTANWQNLGNVRVANMLWGEDWGSYKEGQRAQDMFVLVPEPGSLLLLAIGLLGIGMGCRRARA